MIFESLRHSAAVPAFLLLALACNEFNGSRHKASPQGTNPGSADGGSGIPPKSTASSEPSPSIVHDPDTPIASEPAMVAGAYLIEPGQVQANMSPNSTDMRGSPGSVKSEGDTSKTERSIELVAFDLATNTVQITATTLELSVRVLATAPIEADGSFRIQGTFKLGELLFLRAPARKNSKVLVDSSKTDSALLWLDPNGFIFRRIDQAVAASLSSLVTPAAALLAATSRLSLTNECRGCYLAGVDLSNRNIANADLTDAVLRGAKFNQANAQYVKFIRADLRNSDFSNANVNFSDFQGANLEGVLTQGTASSAAINLQL